MCCTGIAPCWGQHTLWGNTHLMGLYARMCLCIDGRVGLITVRNATDHKSAWNICHICMLVCDMCIYIYVCVCERLHAHMYVYTYVYITMFNATRRCMYIMCAYVYIGGAAFHRPKSVVNELERIYGTKQTHFLCY